MSSLYCCLSTVFDLFAENSLLLPSGHRYFFDTSQLFIPPSRPSEIRAAVWFVLPHSLNTTHTLPLDCIPISVNSRCLDLQHFLGLLVATPIRTSLHGRYQSKRSPTLTRPSPYHYCERPRPPLIPQPSWPPYLLPTLLRTKASLAP